MSTNFQLSDWNEISTVLLDMDGTLLDLAFDNQYWLEHIPNAYAHKHGIPVVEAKQHLFPKMDALQGKLEWYCLDYWEAELDMPLIKIKQTLSDQIRYRRDAEHFLQALQEAGKEIVMVTNAHRSVLSIKADETGLLKYFHKTISSHDYGHPKETQAFWDDLTYHHHIHLQECLFIDDSLSVLKSAERAGVGFLLSIHQPDSTGKHRDTSPFQGLHDFASILPIPPSENAE